MSWGTLAGNASSMRGGWSREGVRSVTPVDRKIWRPMAKRRGLDPACNGWATVCVLHLNPSLIPGENGYAPIGLHPGSPVAALRGVGGFRRRLRQLRGRSETGCGEGPVSGKSVCRPGIEIFPSRTRKSCAGRKSSRNSARRSGTIWPSSLTVGASPTARR